MRIKKKDLNEIIDTNGELIGDKDTPSTGSDLESAANGTTDQNVRKAQQPFRYDMLGRFGFTMMPFMEGKSIEEQSDFMRELIALMHSHYAEILEYYYRNPNKLKPDFRKSQEEGHGHCDECEKRDIVWANEVMEKIQKELENTFNDSKQIDESVVDENISLKKPLTFKSTKNDLFNITFKFDDKGRLSGVDNKWGVKFPDWWGLDVPENMIVDFFRKKYPEFYLVDGSLNEDSVVEDKLVDKKSEEEISNKTEDKGVRDKKLEKIAGLIDKLDQGSKDKLKNLLERKNG